MHCTRLAENCQKFENSSTGHHHTTLSGFIFAIKTRIDNRKKNLLNSNNSPIYPHNMVNFAPLTAEIGLVIWGIPPNVNRFHVMAALLHGTQMVGVSQTLWCWTEGATYIWQGGHHVGHWPTFLVAFWFLIFLVVGMEMVHVTPLRRTLGSSP